MLYVKLSWMPPYLTALDFDENHYAELADNDALDVSTNNFNTSCIFRMDSTITNTTARKLLVGKGLLDLSSANGWYLALVPSAHKIQFRFNDGNATAVAPETADDIYVGDAWYWLFAGIDRSSNVNLWLGNFATGALTNVLTYSLTSRPGTWSNANALWMGNWGADPGNYIKGQLSHVRLDVGRLVPDDWITQEWDRIRYGFPLHIGDFTAFWEFQSSLVDSSSAAYTMVYTGGGDPSYVDGPPYDGGPVELLLAKSRKKIGDAETELEAMTSARALDGTLNTCLSYTKKIQPVDFEGITLAEKTALRAAHASGNLIDFYQDSLMPRSFQGMMLKPPEVQEITPTLFEGSFELEEA